MRKPTEPKKPELQNSMLLKSDLPNSELLKSKLLSWRPDKIGTLAYLLRDNPQTQINEVMLIEKLSGHGQGLINGPGGKLEPTETIYDCAHRELFEEVGVITRHLTLRARIRFVDLQQPQWLGFVFTTTTFTGSPTASVEAIPTWHATQDLPWSQMWPSDQCWLPTLLATDKPLDIYLLFDAGKVIAEQITQS